LKNKTEGIAKAKAKGVYLGRKKSIDDCRVLELAGKGLGASQIARDMGIARQSVYRILKQHCSSDAISNSNQGITTSPKTANQRK
jgi:DNA invertase Pin-like site-specific DNA recombinase